MEKGVRTDHLLADFKLHIHQALYIVGIVYRTKYFCKPTRQISPVCCKQSRGDQKNKQKYGGNAAIHDAARLF
jgi:hypothetical protein